MSVETIAPPTPNTEELAMQREQMAGDYYLLQQAAQEQGKSVDGPMVAGAGLGYDQILAAGYGNYEELSVAAADWKVSQDERDAAAMRADAKAQRNTEAEAHAAAWRADIDAGRKQRQATDERVAAISYRKKLENGGELGLQRNPSLRDRLRAEAFAEAGGEGLNTDHLAPRHFQVPRNPAAEARTSKLGGLLRAHDREVLTAQAKRGGEQAENRVVHKLTLQDSEPITDPSSKGMRARFRKLMGNARGRLQRLSAAYNGAFDKLTSQVVEHPDGDLDATRTPLHKLAGDKLSRAYWQAVTATDEARGRAIEYFSDQEKGDRRRTIATIAGVAALALSTALVLKGLHDGSSNGQHDGTAQEAANNAAPAHGHGGHNPNTGGHNPGTSHNGQPQLEATGPSERLHAGDTIWGDTSEYLSHTKFGHSQANVQKVTAWVLHNQHISWEQARHLPVGYHFELPPHDVLEQLLNPRK